MKRFRLLLLAGAVLLMVAAVAVAQQDTKTDAQACDVDQEAAMAAWMKAATPGEFHKFFAKKSGSWNIHTKMWMEPGAPPMETDGTAESEMILGGRYLKEKFMGTSMGMPFEGLGITGYDNTTGVVTSIWLDSMGTMTTIMTGKYEKPGEPLELHATMLDPSTMTEMKIRTVTTFVSVDEQLFEYYMTVPDMGEVKSMEIVYTRQ